ncbi:MAG: type II secretion system ATPase GspE [candidate division WOR-3 bacterium]|nr:type II secretion system ATPase GspE [candidate division WOR-3 bacterium]MCX7836660.1 type II secretion system ATPase GspE [candidate division WOR-3 bacterium]MDW8113699.1 type II secretion system ATPase GspE [candidate division WOR-3 bacterium]
MGDKKIVHQVLLEFGFSQKEIKKFEEEAQHSNISLEKLLINRGLINKEDFYLALSRRLGVPYLDISGYTIEKEILSLIPEEACRSLNVFPLFKIGDTLTLAMANPTDIDVIDDLRLKTGLEITPVLANEEDIKDAIDKYYKSINQSNIEEITQIISEEKSIEAEITDEIKKLEEEASQEPVVKFVNTILSYAVKNRASDIHIEPEENILRVRLRIDGVLHTFTEVAKSMHPAVISRIKILSRLNIADKLRPQDGQFQMIIDNKKIDFRVSTFPTFWGECAVLRLLDKSSIIIGLSELGFSPENLIKFNTLIKKPYGIILVTGPTGSGKTTTLYSALEAIRSEEKNIITLEDPVEYTLPLIRQIQINPKQGLTFATGLRSVLRQDPDVIMVGEIRDLETAEIAVQAALTGHLVFSTLHTNNAATAVTRLVDIGVEPYLIASSLIGVLAQRLVRKICPACKESYQPKPEILKYLGLEEKIQLFRGKGCEECNNTGYRGRTGIFELLIIDDTLREMILKNKSATEIHQVAVSKGMKTMRDDGFDKVKKGITTIEEVLRVTTIF